MNIYVGNLSHDANEDDLRQAFEAFGKVESVNIIKDKFSGESKGFGFVLMPSDEEARAAIAGANNQDIKGRNVNVAEARPRVENRRGGSGGGGNRRGGFGGGRGGSGGFRGGDRGGNRGGDRSGGGRRY